MVSVSDQKKSWNARWESSFKLPDLLPYPVCGVSDPLRCLFYVPRMTGRTCFRVVLLFMLRLPEASGIGLSAIREWALLAQVDVRHRTPPFCPPLVTVFRGRPGLAFLADGGEEESVSEGGKI